MIQRNPLVLAGLIKLKQQLFELFLIVIFAGITHICHPYKKGTTGSS